MQRINTGLVLMGFTAISFLACSGKTTAPEDECWGKTKSGHYGPIKNTPSDHPGSVGPCGKSGPPYTP